MTPFRERNPVVIGAVGLAVIAALLLLAFNIDKLPLIGGGDVLPAAFTEAGGLQAERRGPGRRRQGRQGHRRRPRAATTCGSTFRVNRAPSSASRPAPR